MAHSGKDHRDSVFVAGIDTVLVFDRTTRLDDSCDSVFSSEIDGITEWEESIGSQYQFFGLNSFCTFDGLLSCPDTVGLTSSDSESLSVGRYDNRIGFYPFDDFLCKNQIVH